MKKLITIVLGLVLLSGSTKAQQDALYSQYMFNGITLNPAYAGNKGVTNFNAIYRNQWVGINGAPVSTILSGDGTVMKRKVGLGGYFQKDNQGAESRLSGYGCFSYKVPLNFSTSLSFGLGLGLVGYQLDANKVQYQDNSAEQTASFSNYAPDARIGAYLSNDQYYLGVSATNMFANKLDASSSLSLATITFTRHYYLSGGYIFPINKGLKFYPSFLVKEDFKGPTDIDLNAFMLFNNMFWFGGSYRTGSTLFKPNYNKYEGLSRSNSIVFIFQVYLNEKIRFGYAYDRSLSDLGQYNSGSHEVSLSYILPTSRYTKMLSPRYF